jgi:hypothetical protein
VVRGRAGAGCDWGGTEGVELGEGGYDPEQVSAAEVDDHRGLALY